jgi:hypothetical protein
MPCYCANIGQRERLRFLGIRQTNPSSHAGSILIHCRHERKRGGQGSETAQQPRIRRLVVGPRGERTAAMREPRAHSPSSLGRCHSLVEGAIANFDGLR